MINNEEEFIDYYKSSLNINNERTSIISNINRIVSNPIILGNNNNSSLFDNKNRKIPFYSSVVDSQLINLNPTGTTAYQTLKHTSNLQKNKLLFDIRKQKKFGRKKKNQSYKNDVSSAHSKYKDDNIIMKIKLNVSNNYLEHLNLILRNSENKQINTIKLKKIDPPIIKVHSQKENLALLESKILDIFSGQISKKFSKVDSNYNEKQIKLIVQKGDEKIINALNKTFKDSLDIYCSKKEIFFFLKILKN